MVAQTSREIRKHLIWHPEIPPPCYSLSLLSSIRNIKCQRRWQGVPAPVHLALEHSNVSHADGWSQLHGTSFSGGEDAGQLAKVTGMTVSTERGATVGLGSCMADDRDDHGEYQEAAEGATIYHGNIADVRLWDHDKESHPTLLKNTAAGETRAVSVPIASPSSSSSSQDVPYDSLGYRLRDVVLPDTQTASANDKKTTFEFLIDGQAGESF